MSRADSILTPLCNRKVLIFLKRELSLRGSCFCSAYALGKGASMCLSPSHILDSVSISSYILSDHSMSLGVVFWGYVGRCWVFPGEVGVGDVD